MRGMKHHLIDVIDPKKQFSASDFVTLTNKAIAKIVNVGKLPIVVGGTGFYIDALTGTIRLPEVPPNPSLRKILGRKGADELFEMLEKKDPARAKGMDPHNKVRLIRALEIVVTIGKVPGCQPATLTPYKFIHIGLKPDNLDKKIRERLLRRLPGMIREGRKLHAQGLTYKRMFELGLEYRYVSLYLRGKLDKVDMANKLYKEIKHYAKRQMIWFKRNKKIKWFEPKDGKKIEAYVSGRL